MELSILGGGRTIRMGFLSGMNRVGEGWKRSFFSGMPSCGGKEERGSMSLRGRYCRKGWSWGWVREVMDEERRQLDCVNSSGRLRIWWDRQSWFLEIGSGIWQAVSTRTCYSSIVRLF
jgi:hypothetical protein